MDVVPSPNVFDPELYSEQMHTVLSEIARTSRLIISPPKKKFDRQKFLSAIDEAFEQIGGVPRFTIWADQNPDKFYDICKRTIPQAAMLDVLGKISHQILPALPPSALDAMDAEFEESNPDGQAQSNE